MVRILDEAIVAATLAGEWHIGTSNIDEWVNGTRRDVVIRFAVEKESPLVLTEEQTFTSKDGKERSVVLANRFVNGEFMSKSRRIVGGAVSRWSIGGIDTEHGILIVRMTHARGGQDGLIVLTRGNAESEELRTIIATRAVEFGIGPEDFASLTWLLKA